jgi:hypothetical protein
MGMARFSQRPLPIEESVFGISFCSSREREVEWALDETTRFAPRPSVGPALSDRRAGQPDHVLQIALRAQRRRRGFRPLTTQDHCPQR